MSVSRRRSALAGLLLGLTVIAVAGAVLLRRTGERSAPGGPHYASYAGYDMSGWRCRFGPDPNDEYLISDAQLFTTIFNRCRQGMLADIDYLAANGLRSVRIFAVAGPLLYDPATGQYGEPRPEVANLDEVLDRLKLRGMTAHLVLNGTYNCTDATMKPPGYFDYRLFTDPDLQDQYLYGLGRLLLRYRDHPAVVSYDLFNEATALIEPEYLRQVINKDRACMTATADQVTALISRMYQQAKTFDHRHPFTVSFAGWSAAVRYRYLTAFAQSVDFYDIHMYVDGSNYLDAAAYYRDFPPLDKPVIHGEVGIGNGAEPLDRGGTPCDSQPFSAGYPATAAAECQQRVLFNTKQWYNAARERGVSAIFFLGWSQTNRYIYRTYRKDSATGNYVPNQYHPSLSGQFLLDRGKERR